MRLDPVTAYQIEMERRQQPPVAVPATAPNNRRAYWKAYYRANREKKLAAANARNHARQATLGVAHSTFPQSIGSDGTPNEAAS